MDPYDCVVVGLEPVLLFVVVLLGLEPVVALVFVLVLLLVSELTLLFSVVLVLSMRCPLLRVPLFWAEAGTVASKVNAAKASNAMCLVFISNYG